MFQIISDMIPLRVGGNSFELFQSKSRLLITAAFKNRIQKLTLLLSVESKLLKVKAFFQKKKNQLK